MPNYAAALQHVVNATTIRPSTQQFAHIPILAALLAEFHSSMSIRGLRYFNGNIDRFMVFCLLLRTSLSQPEHSGTISVHSAAMSLGRPFETVRRHICALLEDRVCQRTRSGVTLSEAFWARHDNWQQLRYAHDCFVRLIADGVPHGLFSVGAVPATTSTRLPLTDGVCAAIDLYLALAEANRTLCSESLDLAIFSVVLHSNYQALQADRALGGFGGPAILLPRHGVRVAQIARVLSTPDTTVRRRVAPLSVEGGPFRRTTGGLLVSPDYLRQRDQPCNSNSAKHGSIRLIVQRAVAAGLSLRDPVRSYSDGRPPTPRID